MDEPWVLLSSGGNQQSFQNRGSCPDLTKNWTGDGDISWGFDWDPTLDMMPAPFATVEAHDDQGLIQTARFVEADLPDTKACAGPATYRAEGLYATLGDRKYDASRVFGFRFPDTTGVIATTAHAAVEDALNQIGGQYLSGYLLPSSSFELTDSEDFIGRSALDVIGSMNTVAGGLATPLVAQVRNGYFTWTALDLAARYQVDIEGSSAKAKPHYDATKVFNRVIVLWGKGNQPVTYPETVVYDQVPTAVDLVVNATTEVFTIDAAQQLAKGLYQRVQSLEYGWSCIVTIPWGAGVDELGVGPISPARIRTARMIRLANLNAVSRWGANAARFTDLQLIKSARWNGKAKELTLDCGEVRSQTDTVRFQAGSGSSRMIWSYQTPGLSTPVPANDKLAKFGPQLTEDAIASGVPAPVSYGVTAYNKETNQVLPTHSFPAPVKVKMSGRETSVPVAGLLTPGLGYMAEVPPCELTYWKLACTPSGSISIQVHTAARAQSSDGRGPYTVPLVADRLILTASVSGSTFAETYIAADAIERITEDSILLFTIVSATTVTAWVLDINGNRIVPGFPAGLDTVPAVGTKSA